MEEKKGTKGIKRSYSAGGVVYKEEKGKLLWLVIKPQGYDRWQLPKGLIEEGESSRQTAEREVGEEGGVKVKVLEKIGNSQYFFVWESQRIFKNVVYYLMQYAGKTERGHDTEVDDVEFLPFGEAYKKLTYKDDKKMLEKAAQILGKN